MLNQLLTIISIVLTIAVILVTVDSLRWLVLEQVYLENKYFCVTDKDCEQLCSCANVIYAANSCTSPAMDVKLTCSCRAFYCVARASE